MTLIYVYDALCGWCYGFSPVIARFKEAYANQFNVEVLSGGMITGNRIGQIGEVAPYIKWAYKEVENTTGITFGEAFLNDILEDGKTVFNSIPPAIALSVFKNSQKENSLAFAASIQKAIYYDGIEPEDFEAYRKIAAGYGLDASTFISNMKAAKFEKSAHREFEISARLGVRGFPSLVLESEGSYHKVGSGFMPFEVLKTKVFEIAKQLK